MKPKVYVKVYRVHGEIMVAMCDEDVLGLKLSEGGIVLHVNPEFYKGKLMDVDEAAKILDEATIANIVGRHAVEIALKKGLVHEESIIKVCGVPHVQVVKMRYY